MTRDILILVGISLLWGEAWLLGPGLAEAATPFAVSALSLLFAGGCALAFSLFRRGEPVPFRANLLLSLTLFAAPQTLLILAGRHGTAGWTPLLYSLMPLGLAFAEGAWTPAMAVAPGAVLVLLNGTVPFAPEKALWALPALAAVGLQAFALLLLRRLGPGRALARALGTQSMMAGAMVALAGAVLDRPQHVSFALLLPLHALLAIALPYGGLFLLLTGGALRPAQVAATQWSQTLAAAGTSLLLARAHPSGAVFLAAGALLVCSFRVLRERSAPEDAYFLKSC